MKYRRFWNFTIVLSFAFLGFGRSNPTPNVQNTGKYELCTTKICEQTGDAIIGNIDDSISPCNNFYQHACGRWGAKNIISRNKVYTSQLSKIRNKLQSELKSLVQEMLESNEISGQTIRKVMDYYRSCANLNAIDDRGFDPLASIIKANGGWPLTMPSEKWNLTAQNLTLQKIHENYAKVAVRPALYSIKVKPAQWDPSVNVLHLKSPTVSVARLLAGPVEAIGSRVAAYIEYALAVSEELARLGGYNTSLLDIKEDFGKIFQFETSLQTRFRLNNLGDKYMRTNQFFGLTTIAELQTQWDKIMKDHPEFSIDWLGTIRNSFGGTGVVIEATEKIAVTEKNFIRNLARWLKENSLRTVVNYVHWHAIDSLLLYTHKKMREMANDYMKSLKKPQQTDDERSHNCIAKHKMIHGLYYAYAKRYFGGNITRATANTMITEILSEMKQQFERSTWMDDEAKSRSKSKIDNIVQNIGYPLWYDEPRKIEEYYSELEIGLNYFENVVNCHRFDRKKLLKKLRDINDRHNAEWILQPMELDAHYNTVKNSMTFGASMFQMPFFAAERPLVFNYGAIGSIIGHETAHAFENDGRRYDEFGNRKRWWQPSTINAYKEKNKCFIDQYNEYTIESHMGVDYKINGENTLDENIADNTGFSVALRSYLHYKKKHNLHDIRIPSLQNFSDERLFFYSMSSVLCSSYVPQAVLRLFSSDEHSSDEVRINGVVSNLPEFSEAFSCPIGSPMNPVEKCFLWN